MSLNKLFDLHIQDRNTPAQIMLLVRFKVKGIIQTFFICIYYIANSILGTIWPFILLKLLQLAHNLNALTCHRGSPLVT